MDNNIVLISIGLYLILLLTIGFIANRQRKSDSSSDFYLANRNFGAFVLVLTLFATQYSGNSLLGVSGQTVRQGMGMVLSIGLLSVMIICYLTFAPKLFTISKSQQFVTPGDYLDFRYNSSRLSLAINIVILIAALSFLLTQLIAMGRITSGLTANQIPYWAGVVFLAIIVLIYESLGGLLAVAWTDVLQGLMLLIGLTGLFFIAVPSVESLEQITLWIQENAAEKAAPPSTLFTIYWASSLVMFGFGAAVYPQAIQRIYSAKSTKVLKKAFSIMIFMPLFTILILFLLGVVSIPHFAGVEGAAGDTVLPQMMAKWAENSTLAYYLMILVIVGILAALMSTADSVLLSISSILAIDILGKSTHKNLSDEALTKLGKKISIGLMIVMVLLALIPDLIIYKVAEYKFALSAQTAPAFVLGLHSKKIQAKALLIGMFSGIIITLIISLLAYQFLPSNQATLMSMPAGAIGFFVNVFICFWGSRNK